MGAAAGLEPASSPPLDSGYYAATRSKAGRSIRLSYAAKAPLLVVIDDQAGLFPFNARLLFGLGALTLLDFFLGKGVSFSMSPSKL